MCISRKMTRQGGQSPPTLKMEKSAPLDKTAQTAKHRGWRR